MKGEKGDKKITINVNNNVAIIVGLIILYLLARL